MAADTFFITTAIDYTNGAPHIGHAYEKVLADVLARYHRLKDERGLLSYWRRSAWAEGPAIRGKGRRSRRRNSSIVITGKFIALWEKLGVQYDGWAATTAERHKTIVRAILQRLWDEKNPATGHEPLDLQGKAGGVLFRAPGTVSHGQGTRAGWGVRRGLGRGRVSRRGELLFPAGRSSAVARRPA